tara:strand:- start:13978 stop:14946 length:969 start_codon:yes stop_codon:yes gene_type:complete
MDRATRLSSKMLGSILTVAILATIPSVGVVHATVLDSSSSLDQPVQTEPFGRSLLIEEITATWCPTCAELDPYLMGVADSHGSRIAMVAYHPSDGVDAFQPPASQHRIDRLGMMHPDIGSTPTFLVEGMNPRIGSESWVDVQRDILDIEIQRQSTTTLQFEVVRSGSSILAKVVSFNSPETNLSDTQLTFLVAEHDKELPSGSLNPGGGTRDRVVVATAECSLANSTITKELGLRSANVSSSCQDGFEIEFDAIEEFSLILVHEYTVEAIEAGHRLGTLGAVEFAYRPRNVDSSGSAGYLILPLMIAAGIVAILPPKKKSKD